MACNRYAVVIRGENEKCFVLVPSADQAFCEEVAAHFNARCDGTLSAEIAPHLLGDGLSALLSAPHASTQKKPCRNSLPRQGF